jgi:rhodanese-related sulfurtransferase
MKARLIFFALIALFLMAAPALAQNQYVKSSSIQFIGPEELKAKVSRNEKLLILDVRSTDSYASSNNRIKGAMHIKLRRLKSRLTMPPIKDVPRDREVITYCACPNEESAIRAAQILVESGFKNVRALKSGWDGWLKVGGPVESRPKG